MLYASDVIAWRVYSAEQPTQGGQTSATAAEVIAFAESVTVSRWWATTYPDAPTIKIGEAATSGPGRTARSRLVVRSGRPGVHTPAASFRQ